MGTENEPLVPVPTVFKNRCPGYMQAKAKQLFESTGGTYIEVPMDYRASQYDHTADAYIKKKLSQRMYCLTDGTKVQRDWYTREPNRKAICFWREYYGANIYKEYKNQ